MRFISIVLLIFLLPSVLFAQTEEWHKKPEISMTPICATLLNTAPYRVRGHLATNYTEHKERGVRARHMDNFSLGPNKRLQFCTKGPFYEGGRIELVIKTLIPVFSCLTRIEGEIIITGKKNADGETETKAFCR